MSHGILGLGGLSAAVAATAAQAGGDDEPGDAGATEARLIAILKSPEASRKAKADACRQLSVIGSRAAVGPLAELLGDEELGHMARYALEPIPDPAVDDALRGALDKLSGRLLVGVIGSIGVRRDPRAVDALARRLQDPDSQVVRAAARALGRIGTLEAAAALEKALVEGITTTPAGDRLALAEGLLRCADALAAKGESGAAERIYAKLETAPVPSYVREAARRGRSSLAAT